jgi:hypothetical protein
MIGRLPFHCSECGEKNVIEYELHKGSLISVDPEECPECCYDWTDELVSMFEPEIDEELEETRHRQFELDLNSRFS